MAKLRPLYMPRASGAGGGGRDASVPTLVNGPLTNGASYFEDFFSAAVSLPVYGGAGVGQPDWIYTATGAGPPTIGISATAVAPAAGVLQINAGGVGSVLVLEVPGRTTTSGGTMIMGPTYTSLGQWRFGHGGATSASMDCVGWVISTTAIGADCVTDPDTTFATSTAVLIHRNLNAAYSGDASGDLVARVYSGAGVDNDSLLLATSAVAGTFYHNVEVLCKDANLTFWLNGAEVGSIDIPNWGANVVMKPVIAHRSESAALRLNNVDSYYQELSLPSAR